MWWSATGFWRVISGRFPRPVARPSPPLRSASSAAWRKPRNRLQKGFLESRRASLAPARDGRRDRGSSRRSPMHAGTVGYEMTFNLQHAIRREKSIQFLGFLISIEHRHCEETKLHKRVPPPAKARLSSIRLALDPSASPIRAAALVGSRSPGCSAPSASLPCVAPLTTPSLNSAQRKPR